MVVASIRSEKKRGVDELPIIDLSGKSSDVSRLIVRACEDYGFFKVVNHGVPNEIISKVEEESLKFFAKPASEKQEAGPANPFGYGCKNIGFNGDIGEVEYLLLSTNSLSISQRSQSISTEPVKFSSAVNSYVQAVKGLACEILDLMAEGLWVPDTSVFSRLIADVESDSMLRFNYYPLLKHGRDWDTSPLQTHHRVGFGAHSDPQILTILRSNDVGGLQISLDDGVWVPVTPDPDAFCVNVGDLLQAMTNGRFVSVRHRALTNSYKPRLSMAYFAGPPLQAWVTSPPEIRSNEPTLYRPFTWAEYKKAMYSLRLGDCRLDLFRIHPHDHIAS